MTGIEEVGHTRVKECDRLEACAENLRRMGIISVETVPDWIGIHPGTSGLCTEGVRAVS